MHSHTHTYAGSCHALRTHVRLHIFSRRTSSERDHRVSNPFFKWGSHNFQDSYCVFRRQFPIPQPTNIATPTKSNPGTRNILSKVGVSPNIHLKMIVLGTRIELSTVLLFAGIDVGDIQACFKWPRVLRRIWNGAQSEKNQQLQRKTSRY